MSQERISITRFDFTRDDELDYVAFSLVFFAAVRYGSKEALLDAAYVEARSIYDHIKEQQSDECGNGDGSYSFVPGAPS